MDNVALSGGALYFGDYSASGGINTFYLTNNTIYRNHATYSTTTNMGGGVYRYASGGISFYTDTGQDQVIYLRNNFIAYNAAGGINNIYYYDLMPYSNESAQVYNVLDYYTKNRVYLTVDTWANSIDSYTQADLYGTTNACCGGGGSGYDDMGIAWDDEKRFKFANSTGNLIVADYYYAPSIDINEVSRPQGSGDDVGAFEYKIHG